mgnify:CR=1 FL=1
MRGSWLAVTLLFLRVAAARDVTVAVFGLFHPTRLEVAAVKGEPLTVRRPGQPDALVNWPGSLTVIGPAETAAASHFVLRVPGRIERAFTGRLAVYQQGGELTPVIAMGLETAVAGIVAAESPPGSPDESLRAQAVVARSYLLSAHGRHARSDFCDTTHCQFLREAPDASSPYARAARNTRGMVLVYNGAPVEALYSADCGGRTRTLAEARLASGPYPYFAVDCPIRGGPSSGHRIGLCQRGSAAMARAGASWRDILRLYFPGTGVSVSE